MAVSGMSVCILHMHTFIHENAFTRLAAEDRNEDSFAVLADPESDIFLFCSWSRLCLNRAAVLNYCC